MSDQERFQTVDGLKDRRASARVPAEIWVEESRAGEIYFQRTANLSEGGLFFERTIPHPMGTVVNLKFTLPGARITIECRGEIVNLPRDTEGLGMGIKFLDMKEEQKVKVSDFIKSLSNGSVLP